MKRTGLIGLGVITRRYIAGFEKSEILKLCAVADIDPNACTRELYEEYPFYADYKEMITSEKPEYVIISTPPESHFEIASYCLENNVNIIIEKPVTLCMKEFDTLCKIAQEKGLVFRTLFHWQGGAETRAFGDIFDLSDIGEIKVNVFDPYCDNGTVINHDRRPLMGAWVDSGVNALSMIKLWLPFEKLEIVSTETQRCTETGLPVYVQANLIIDGVRVYVTVDWRKGREHKESYITLKDRTVYINHSAQSVTDGDIVREYARMQRLDEHYCRLFQEFDGVSNLADSRLVHKFLLEVNGEL